MRRDRVSFKDAVVSVTRRIDYYSKFWPFKTRKVCPMAKINLPNSSNNSIKSMNMKKIKYISINKKLFNVKVTHQRSRA